MTKSRYRTTIRRSWTTRFTRRLIARRHRSRKTTSTGASRPRLYYHKSRLRLSRSRKVTVGNFGKRWCGRSVPRRAVSWPSGVRYGSFIQSGTQSETLRDCFYSGCAMVAPWSSPNWYGCFACASQSKSRKQSRRSSPARPGSGCLWSVPAKKRPTRRSSAWSTRTKKSRRSAGSLSSCHRGRPYGSRRA